MTTKTAKNAKETKQAAGAEELRLAYEVHTLANLLLRHMAAGTQWGVNPVFAGGAPMGFQGTPAWGPSVGMPGLESAAWPMIAARSPWLM